mgnify:CR=1 FL=1
MNRKEKINSSIISAAFVLFAVAGFVAGCSTADANPASRVTSAKFGDIGEEFVRVEINGGGSNSVSVTASVTIGDNALASADSSGSTETTSPTQTPTNSTSVPINIKYNDAIAGASAASKGLLETLTDVSKEAVLQLMQNKQTGTVNVTKLDGTTACVSCQDGQCSLCEDCPNGLCDPRSAKPAKPVKPVKPAVKK